MADAIIAIDQGTTSSRAIVHDTSGRKIATAQEEFAPTYPASGWVEHDPETIWVTTARVARSALERAVEGGVTPVALGVTNQRETTLIWDRASGRPIHNAIVWQDRRTADQCAQLKASGYESTVNERTGLLLDPYFSATKIAWLLDNVDGARERAERGELAFGTVDTWLIWRLTGGRTHATDATNAARTMLFNIHSQEWDDDLLELFGVPRALLPEVRDSADDFGTAAAEVLGRALPIRGVAGDQHAAMVGQACFHPGMIKSTYGTGCFALMNTGERPVVSQNRLLTTLAYRIDGQPTYALEGAIFVAGAAIQWLRDELGILASAADSAAAAERARRDDAVYFVPAFAGLGAPYWDPDARAAIVGLTRDTGADELVRAALEAACFQTHDLVAAMADDAGRGLSTLRADGGMAVNDWMLQRLADLTGLAVERPADTETTALGASSLAGLGHGLWDSLSAVEARWAAETRFEPTIEADRRTAAVRGWQEAVSRVLSGR